MLSNSASEDLRFVSWAVRASSWAVKQDQQTPSRQMEPDYRNHFAFPQRNLQIIEPSHDLDTPISFTPQLRTAQLTNLRYSEAEFDSIGGPFTVPISLKVEHRGP